MMTNRNINKWYYTPEQALDSFFRSKLRGILPYLLVHRAPALKLQRKRKRIRRRIKLIVFLLAPLLPSILSAQGNLEGNWKYSSPEGEMVMQFNSNNMVIDGQSYPYKIENNILQVYDGNIYTGYPYSLKGNQLTLVFPDGMEVLFARDSDGNEGPIKLPQGSQKAHVGQTTGEQSASLSGKWIFQGQGGQVVLEFSSGNQLTFNGETTRYQLKEGIIQAMGDYGWIDYPYSFNNGNLIITFPDGTQVPFSRTSSIPTNQQSMGDQAQDSDQAWRLQGSLCYWSGSSGSYSSYSRSEKISFDGRGNFTYGNESSFSGDAGMAYGGNPNAEGGTYRIENNMVYLQFRSGETMEVQVSIRQDNGRITALKYNDKLYAVELCE
jgi:hypothetical protein